MTKKDYIAIAEVFRHMLEENTLYRQFAEVQRREYTRELADRLCVILQRDNPRFDRTRFLEACGF